MNRDVTCVYQGLSQMGPGRERTSISTIHVPFLPHLLIFSVMVAGGPYGALPLCKLPSKIHLTASQSTAIPTVLRPYSAQFLIVPELLYTHHGPPRLRIEINGLFH